MLISLLFSDPLVFFAVAAALVISLSIHEFAHAYVADRLGDPTPYNWGRVTLDPRAHLDPVGTLLLLFAGFGWGRPVPINPYNMKNPKRDSAIVSLAGPLSNLVLASLCGVLLMFISQQTVIGSFLSLVVFYNLILGIFNLIPIHPLDGFKIVNGVLPKELSEQWIQIAPYGVYLLILLVLTGAIRDILNPIINFSLSILGLRL